MEPAVATVVIFGGAIFVGLIAVLSLQLAKAWRKDNVRKQLVALGLTEHAWAAYTTPASIEFVIAAEKYLETCGDSRERAELVIAIHQLKNGEMVFRPSRTVEEYLRGRV